jgi:TRAP-type mannitol/chloroaromatic compound transport system substrate-binding protein
MAKKTLMLLLSVAVIASLVLAGCAPEAAPPAEEEEEAAPEEEEEEEAPPAAPEEEVFELAWQDISPPDASMYIVLDRLCNQIRAASGGRLDITLYSEGELTPRHETTPAVQTGAIDMATNSSPMDLGRMGNVTYLMGSSGLPAGPSTSDLIAWVYQGGGLEIMNEVYKDWGYILGTQPGAPELFCHSNKPLEKAADFKGLKFRTLGLWAEILETYDVSVVMIAGGELYQSVERGVLDAFELGPPSYNWPHGFQEILKYIGVPGIQSPGFCNNVLINKESYDSLPSDLQDLLKDEILGMALYGQLYLAEADAAAMDMYRDYGTIVFTVSDELQQDIAAKSKAALEGYTVGDPQFAEVWEHQKAFFKMWRGLGGIYPKYTVFD